MQSEKSTNVSGRYHSIPRMSTPEVRVGTEEAEWHCERARQLKKPEEVEYSDSKQRDGSWRCGLAGMSDDASASVRMIADNGEDGGSVEAWPWPW